MSDAVDELLSWEALTVAASLDATPEQVRDYLSRSAARNGTGRQPSAEDARLLSQLELTVAVGDPGRDEALRDLDEDDPLDGAMTVNFGGRDVTGIKNIGDRTYVRLGTEALVEEVLGGDEAAVSRAHRFEEDTDLLPGSLENAARALGGDWVEVDPYEFDAYAQALHESGHVDAATADRLGGALLDGGELLTPEAQWELVEELNSALRSGATLHPAGQAGGAELVTVTMSAGDARRALGPLFTVLAAETERFGLPPLVDEPADENAPVEAQLAIRNGVLDEVTVDLGQFGGPEAGSLPLSLSLAGGSALSLNAPESGEGEGAEDRPLTPDDLAVALLYLQVRDEERAADEDRADVPGPMQP
ncbi:hypothetical protein D7294_21585 [Streptomyces hoynatensis]|uniref:Uncharacterized protein n=1 Tax=Streptomyces hoynatensis TaxID=1141874 RepID=A0A3A9YT72_9ACTN|nr:hypothetical protein D7294_21585 [Streptomyces hoynatensis]